MPPLIYGPHLIAGNIYLHSVVFDADDVRQWSRHGVAADLYIVFGTCLHAGQQNQYGEL